MLGHLLAQEIIYAALFTEDDEAKPAVLVYWLSIRGVLPLKPRLFDLTYLAKHLAEAVLVNVLWDASHKHLLGLLQVSLISHVAIGRHQLRARRS